MPISVADRLLMPLFIIILRYCHDYLEKHQKANNPEAIEKLLKISPVAWKHIHLLGHYIFCSNKHPIDLDEIISSLAFI